MILRCIKFVLRPFVHAWRRVFIVSFRWKKLFSYDRLRFKKYSGSFNQANEMCALSRIIMAYHVLEKGLTMPNRRLGFGREAVLNLIYLIEAFYLQFGKHEQVSHAAGCVATYLKLHQDEKFDMASDPEFWERINTFVLKQKSTPVEMISITRDAFFALTQADFEQFAKSRHTVRYFEGEVDKQKIEKAVTLAMTAPSACNRQYIRIHCVSNHETRDAILALQNGNRGFGNTADKLLVITADLQGLRWHEERNDLYTNAGIMLMNLSYALHYCQLGSCILNWSVSPENDQKARKILLLPNSETIVAILAIGELPKTLQICPSPRKSLSEVLIHHE